MNRASKSLFYATAGMALTICTAMLVQYQVRLRMLVGEPLIAGED